MSNIVNITDKQFAKDIPTNIGSATLYQIQVVGSRFETVHDVKNLGTVLITTESKQLLSHTLISHVLLNSGFTVFHFYQAEQLPSLESYDDLISSSVVESLDQAIELVSSKAGVTVDYFTVHKPTSWGFSTGSELALVHIGSSFSDLTSVSAPVVVVRANVLPLNLEKFYQVLPSSVKLVSLLEQSPRKPISQFSPLLLDFFSDRSLIEHGITKISSAKVAPEYTEFSKLIQIVSENLQGSDLPLQNVFFGDETVSEYTTEEINKINKVIALESSYLSIIDQLFGSNGLTFWNQFDAKNADEANPQYAYGKYLYSKERRAELFELISESLKSPDTHYITPKINRLIELLQNWLITKSNASLDEVVTILEDSQPTATSTELLNSKAELYANSNWLVTSDSWAEDLGNSGIHQVLQSKENLNLLVIDNDTYGQNTKRTKSKKDIGLYAMNYGDAYVGSIAIYSSYTQMMSTLIEAEKFQGPSVIVAYLPIDSEDDSTLDILKNTKNAVETGHFPLYRYDPSISNEDDVFKLDSSVIKDHLKNFLDRENKLTLLTRKDPQLARSLTHSQAKSVTEKISNKAQSSYNELLASLSKGDISIYFASDGGQAENLARNLGKKLTQLSMTVKIGSMDDVDLETLPTEQNVAFITSTSGQGEFPQNGKKFWESLKNAGDLDLSAVNIAIFGLGDSLYWPRLQDKHFYNKPAVDLHKKLTTQFQAKELIRLGLGDDQDSDGWKTNYKPWELELFTNLGLDVSKSVNEPAPLTNEDMKIQSNFLRGTIVEGLNDSTTGAISAVDQQLTKFHGIYMQDDRDIRDARKAAGFEPAYSFMARVRLPGGIANAEQWLAMDDLADKRGNGTLKITTRATFQLHGVVKHNLKPAIRKMNSVLMDTLAACGDVNRNVMVSALPANAHVHSQVSESAKLISEYLLPQTTAYHEIWLQGTDSEDDEGTNWPEIFSKRKEGPKKFLVAGEAVQDVEPMYSPVYLPRKFKINITVPPYNDVDVWSSDIGLVAIIQDNELVGYNVLVGGGMGTTHNNKKTYPRTGSNFGFVTKDQVHIVCEKVMLVQRDNGNRKDRKNARLKYTIDTLGVEVYKAKVEELWGQKFQPAVDFTIDDNVDHFGWVKDETGLNHFTCFIENGRVENTAELPQKEGFKQVSLYFKSRGEATKGNFRLTGNQHVLICNVSDEELEEVKAIMAKYKLDNTSFSGLRLSSAACVAFPTCGLAMAESERYLPVIITKLEEYLETLGLRHDAIVMRMTGCPNGCARPWLAEIALVGKAYGVYNLMLGGGFHGQRLNKIYRQNLKEEEILDTLKPLFLRWSKERLEGEHFGDFVVRVGVIKPTLEGKFFHDDVPEEE
ncbi:hypothetical protein WICPIJ_000387 [Wickerhamomyces pijperi]|uniref:assimilatory sulfite reductase (NADPH) n=1 Tax=Wickerhamomyces pijperi TaxID=599730 RepID=A0A9P8TS02_WICPI|nr:hypothetical protein WICPIJ_000387 [Wickerhamomyces pijperi]